VIPAARLQAVTECAARVLSKPMVETTCSWCSLPSGEVPADPAFAGRRVDRLHAACIPAFRAFHFAPTVSA
jgi:hypothetical protein